MPDKRGGQNKRGSEIFVKSGVGGGVEVWNFKNPLISVINEKRDINV